MLSCKRPCSADRASPGNLSGGRGGGEDSDDFESANEETHDEEEEETGKPLNKEG